MADGSVLAVEVRGGTLSRVRAGRHGQRRRRTVNPAGFGGANGAADRS